MKGVVALYDPQYGNATGDYIPILDVGRTEDCRNTIKFDLDKNETVSSVTYWYDEYAIRMIELKTTLKAVYSQGGRNDNMQRQVFDLESKFPLIGFHGTWLPAYITSLGIVVTNATCIPDTEAYVEEEESSI